MKIALVHDWLINPGGAEKCLEVFHELYPAAPLYTLLYSAKTAETLNFEPEKVTASHLQKRPGILKNYRKYLALLPFAIEQFDLSEFDIILSSSHCVAKGVLSKGEQLHICYCHTPVRYAWDLTHEYLRENSLEKGFKSLLARIVLHYIRLWDLHSANRVDYFIANSQYTARKIWRTYRRRAEVIYPPVNLQFFQPRQAKKDYFIFVSRLVAYKKAELVIKAFNELGLPLVVVGEGPQEKRCHRIAGNNVSFLGYKAGPELAELMGNARALVFAAEEDFGIVPLEAQACGTPVIAYGRGGLRETVIPADESNWDKATGIFFGEQSIAALTGAVEKFVKWEKNFQVQAMVKNAQRFSRERFCHEISSFVQEKYRIFKSEL